MTENERKQIKVMLREQKRRHEEKIAARNAANPRGIFPKDIKRWLRDAEDVFDRS
jgi:hypothetical protein